MKRKYLAFAVPLVFALPVFAQEATPEANLEPIIIEEAGILPEGVEYDAQGNRFLFGSLSQGTLFQIAESGAPEPFIEDEDLVSSVGIHVDVVNNRLLVSNSNSAVFADQNVQGIAGLAAYDLESGERLFYADLGALLPGGRHFANDVTVDVDGNAYVTDSFSPVIYRVDAEGNAEVFVDDDQLWDGQFATNGIDYHPDGYLLVAVGASGAVFKIPVDDPAAWTAVELSEPLSIDGMVLVPDGGAFYAVAVNEGGTQELVGVTSDDDWATAEVSARLETGGSATTVTLRDGVPYYINAYLGDPTAEQYEIVPAIFDAVG
jgi:sugar lactone lactonase YvrE